MHHSIRIDVWGINAQQKNLMLILSKERLIASRLITLLYFYSIWTEETVKIDLKYACKSDNQSHNELVDYGLSLRLLWWFEFKDIV